MTNGIGASIGMICAQVVVNHFTYAQEIGGEFYTMGNWSAAWFVFAGYALVVAILFAICFRNPGKGPYSKIA